MALEDLLKKAKEAYSKDPRTTPGNIRVERPPEAGRITEYGKVPDEELARAIDHYENDPSDAEGEAYLGFLFYTSERYEDAIRHFNHLLEVDYKASNQHFHLGNCYFKLGNGKSAKKHWKRCLELGPSDAIAKLVKLRLDWV